MLDGVVLLLVEVEPLVLDCRFVLEEVLEELLVF